MSPVSQLSLLLLAVCGLAAAHRSAHVSPSLEERAALRRGPCQLGWTLSEDRCFRLSPVAAAWSEARRRCSQLRPAARLASGVTSADQELVRALWREAVRTQPAARRQEAALWVDPIAVERTKAALKDGYGALKMTAGPQTSEGSVTADGSAVVVGVGTGSAQSPEPEEQECPSLPANQSSTRQAGYSCNQKLPYVCELDTVDLNTTEV